MLRLAGARGLFVRHRGVGLAALTARVPRVCARAAVTMMVALAALCVMVPAAQAHYLIAYQAKTDGPNNLFTYDPTVNSATDVEAGMAPGTSPSINNGIVAHIAFQANTGNLDVTGKGDLQLGMAPGTSPSIDANSNEVAFQSNAGELWTNGGEDDGDWHLGMAPGTSPSTQGTPHTAFESSPFGYLWNLSRDSPNTFAVMASGTSGPGLHAPSIDNGGDVLFQGENNSLWGQSGDGKADDLHAGMAPNTSPSLNDSGEYAFQANTGHLWTGGPHGCAGPCGDTGQAMAPNTSPSVDAYGNVAFQGSNGDLWLWDGLAAHDLGQAMAPNTSPSIQPGITLIQPPPPTSVIRGGPDDDRLDSGAGSDLIRGRAGNDVTYGGPGSDVTQGGPGKDRIYGGRGRDFLHGGRGDDVLYGGLGKNRIVDHRGATTVFAGSDENLVDVADGRGDDRVVCAPGSFTDVFADRGDRTGSCGTQGLPIPSVRVPQPRNAR
jgi:Ca2+-binding RTX toxin-like protein